MTMVHEVAATLEGQFDWLVLPESAPDGTDGNLFEDHLPDSPDNAVALFEYGGPGPTQTLGNKNPTERPNLQIMTRHTNVEVAKSWCRQVMKYLITVNDQELGGVRYVKISCVSNPSAVGVDSANRFRFSSNLSVEKEWSPDD